MAESDDRRASPAELRRIAAACAEYLAPAELGIVVTAFNTCEREFVAELSANNSEAFTPYEWAEHVLACARRAIVLQEVEHVIGLYYDEARRAHVRRVMSTDRDPLLFEIISQAVGQMTADEWHEWIVGCVGIALDLDDKKGRQS